jgi:hypothetical protein
VRRLSALLLATAALFMASAAQALTVSEKVGPLVKEAQSLAQAKNYKAALAKLNEAEAVNHTPDDMTVITQMRQYIGVKAGDVHPAQTPHITPQFPQP